MTEPTATMGMPEVDPLMAEAWSLLIAEGGGMVAIFGLAIGVLWRWSVSMLRAQDAREAEREKRTEQREKDMREREDDRQGRLEGLLQTLIGSQSEGLKRVETAVTKLGADFTHVSGRVDRHDVELAEHRSELRDHARQLATLHGVSGSGWRRVSGEAE